MHIRAFTSALIVGILSISPLVASADATTTTISMDNTSQQILIQQLEAQLASLKQQLAFLLAQRATNASSTSVATPSNAAATGSFCVVLDRTLSLGMQGDDVSQLQKALASDPSIYALGSVTGYFGNATQAAVLNLQTRFGILVDGSATGIVGPQTRAFLSSRCSSTGSTQSAPAVGNGIFNSLFGTTNPQPGLTTVLNSAPTTTPKVITDVFRWVVASPATTTPGAAIPSINSFSGPTSLKTNQTGTWTINASDSKNEALVYSVNWGDATSSAANILMAMAGGIDGNTSTIPTFQHSFAKAGVYPVSVSAKNTDGIGVTASSIVLVSDQPATSVADLLNTISNSSTTLSNLLNNLSGVPTTTSSTLEDATSWLTQGTFCSMFPSLCTLLGTSSIQTTIQNNNPFGTASTGQGAGNTTGLPGYSQTLGQACSPSGTYEAVWAAPGLLIGAIGATSTASSGSIVQLQCSGGKWIDPVAGSR